MELYLGKSIFRPGKHEQKQSRTGAEYDLLAGHGRLNGSQPGHGDVTCEVRRSSKN